MQESGQFHLEQPNGMWIRKPGNFQCQDRMIRRNEGEASQWLVTVRRRLGAERPSSAASESARSRTRSACAASWEASRPPISLSTSSSARRTAAGFSAAISTSSEVGDRSLARLREAKLSGHVVGLARATLLVNGPVHRKQKNGCGILWAAKEIPWTCAQYSKGGNDVRKCYQHRLEGRLRDEMCTGVGGSLC